MVRVSEFIRVHVCVCVRVYVCVCVCMCVYSLCRTCVYSLCRTCVYSMCPGRACVCLCGIMQTKTFVGINDPRRLNLLDGIVIEIKPLRRRISRRRSVHVGIVMTMNSSSLGQKRRRRKTMVA